MPTQDDKNAQAWMSTQAGELMRKKRNQEMHSIEAELKSIVKRSDYFFVPKIWKMRFGVPVKLKFEF